MPASAEKLREKVKNQLSKSHPDWSKEKIDSTSYAVVINQYKKEGKLNPFK
jgi:hypothetical protein